MKKVTFFTIHQAPHNTYMFKSIERLCDLEIFYLREKLKNYYWEKDDFYYPGKSGNNLITYLKAALQTDLSIISGWQNYRYIVLILVLLLLKRKFCIYLDCSPRSLKKHGLIKKIILKKTPYILITGCYGKEYLKKYLRREKGVFDFPYGVSLPDNEKVETINTKRQKEIKDGDKIRVFISNRFIERKGYHLVRALISHLKKQNTLQNFQFSIAGNGPLFEEEKKLFNALDDKIKFWNWIEYPEYHEQMANCDVYLHCSKVEPYGIPPLDAFAYKKEIVTTGKIYSVYDIIQMGGKVHKFNYNRPEGLFGIFDSLSNNREVIYSSNQNISFDNGSGYLFANKHIKAIKNILYRIANRY